MGQNYRTAAPNGSLYVIPDSARRVAKFNTVNKSMTHIGPDLGDDLVKWFRGSITDNGVIYSVPCNEHCGVLKIDTNTDNVAELDTNLLPEQGWLVSVEIMCCRSRWVHLLHAR